LIGRAVAALLGLVAVVVFAGCYGSTEPATDVGPDSATLNARGTANNGPATAYFEYWLSDGSGSTHQTDPAHFPGGSHGPFSQKVTGLSETTSYSFRLCGSDDSGGPAVCAQTRTFRTSGVEDSVTGFWKVSPDIFGTIDAHSGPSGEDPEGYIRSQGPYYRWWDFEGSVTCVAVQGNRAAVGAVGQAAPFEDPSNPQPATMLFTVEDSPTANTDTGWAVFEDGSTPPNCATASFASQFPLSHPDSELVVTDAHAVIPTSAR
jgi:hypothetical protein